MTLILTFNIDHYIKILYILFTHFETLRGAATFCFQFYNRKITFC